MRTKKIPIYFALITLLLITLTSAKLTANIGNSRMILKAEPGEIIEKYVLVKNVNDVPVIIDLATSGDLADEVTLKEESFILQPNTDKKAYFTIKVKKPGTTETKINVKFTSEEGGNSVGLSSNVIIITSGEPEEYEETSDENNSLNFNSIGNAIKNIPDKFKISLQTILIISTILFGVIFLSLFAYYQKINPGKEGRRSRD